MPCNAPSPVINEVAAPRNEAGASCTSFRPYSNHKSASGGVGGLSPKSIISSGIAASLNNPGYARALAVKSSTKYLPAPCKLSSAERLLARRRPYFSEGGRPERLPARGLAYPGHAQHFEITSNSLRVNTTRPSVQVRHLNTNSFGRS